MQQPFAKWLIAFFVTVVSFILFVAIKKYAISKLRQANLQSRSQRYQLTINLINKLHWAFIILLFLYIGSQFLTLPPQIDAIFDKMITFVLAIQLGVLGNQLISFIIAKLETKPQKKGGIGKPTINFLRIFSLTILWVLILLFLLDNLDFDIATLIAGLGIGGIAVALAVQNILGDVLASLSIVIDKPFEVGDFIIVGEYMGSIEFIGIKTTHIRSLSGEQIVIANNDLISSRIRNYKRMKERRVVFPFRVPYQTPYSKVEAIPKMVEKIINSTENVRFDRAHFQKYGDYALEFEVVYNVLSPDYNIFMDIQQSINLKLYQMFEAEEIEMAYPTSRRIP